ncbi:MAG: NusG domain II-containing protein [Aminipila sp.]
MIKKADIILAIILIIFGGVISYVAALDNNQGDTALITVAGKEFGRYSLAENKTITVRQDGHINKVNIKDGTVSMSFSDCSNQICVHTGTISKTSQSIVCLPNKVMVQIIGKGGAEYDAVSN